MNENTIKNVVPAIAGVAAVAIVGIVVVSLGLTKISITLPFGQMIGEK